MTAQWGGPGCTVGVLEGHVVPSVVGSKMVHASTNSAALRSLICCNVQNMQSGGAVATAAAPGCTRSMASLCRATRIWVRCGRGSIWQDMAWEYGDSACIECNTCKCGDDCICCNGCSRHTEAPYSPAISCHLLPSRTLFIEPGSPWENGYVESFNGNRIGAPLRYLRNTVGRRRGFCLASPPLYWTRSVA